MYWQIVVCYIYICYGNNWIVLNQWLTVYTRGIDGEERKRKEKEKDGVFCLAKLSCVLRGSVQEPCNSFNLLTPYLSLSTDKACCLLRRNIIRSAILHPRAW